MRPGASALWPGQASARCGLGQAPYGLGKRPIQQPGSGHGKRTASKLGMRPVTLRRISQHPPVTSKLGLSSRLALPAHFHRQPGFSYVWIVKRQITTLQTACTFISRTQEQTIISKLTQAKQDNGNPLSMANMHRSNSIIEKETFIVNSLLSGSFQIKFSSLSAPTKIEELTAGSDEKKKNSAAPPGIEPRVLRILVARSHQFVYLCRS